jgi:hypothetical protein
MAGPFAEGDDPVIRDWMLPKLIDYWDTRTSAIHHFSRVLNAITSAEGADHVQKIESAIVRHTEALSDEQLTLAAFIVTDDLYKTAAHLSYWDDALEQYLAASAGAFFEALTNRGYSVNYFVDNTYPLLIGPAHWFHVFFQTASMGYICPQEIACRVVEKTAPKLNGRTWCPSILRYPDQHPMELFVVYFRIAKASFT